MHGNNSLCEVNGDPVNLKLIRLRSMNFGQHWRTPGIVNLPYKVKLAFESVLPLLQKELPGFIEDCQKFPTVNDPLEDSLRENNWQFDFNDLEDAKNNQIIFAALEYYAHEILMEKIGDARLEEPGFVLNTIDEVFLERDSVYFVGTCRASAIPVVYQDI